MGASTTHPILSMWIIIYSFSDTYYFLAACGITKVGMTNYLILVVFCKGILIQRCLKTSLNGREHIDAETLWKKKLSVWLNTLIEPSSQRFFGEKDISAQACISESIQSVRMHFTNLWQFFHNSIKNRGNNDNNSYNHNDKQLLKGSKTKRQHYSMRAS